MISRYSYKPLKRAILLLSAVFLLWPAANINWGKDHWVDILEADAKGYYAYLPAVFIYRDINFGFFDKIEKEKYFNENLYYDYRFQFEGNTVNKYFMGTSVLEAPFFLIAHAWASLSEEHDADGFAKPYLVMVNLAAIFYTVISIWILLTFLLPRNNSSLVLGVVLVFGTNLFYYSVCEPGMSHVYSMFLVSVFAWGCKFLPAKKGWLAAGLSLGLIVLIRPTNGLVLFALPFLSGAKWKEYLLQKPSNTLLYLVILPISTASIQLLVYFMQTGSFFVYSYGEEGFNWLQPQIWNALFSFKKGWFIYTPFMLLLLPAIYSLIRSNSSQARYFLSFFVLLLYVNFSWWNWWYGGSFSQRVMIEFYPIFVLLIGHWLVSIHISVAKKSALAFGLVCLLWCQLQTYQYRYELIHWEEMDFERFSSVIFEFP